MNFCSINMDQNENKKFFRKALFGKTPQFYQFLPPKTPLAPEGEDLRNVPSQLQQEQGSHNHCEMQPDCSSHQRPTLQGRRLNEELISSREGHFSSPASLSVSPMVGKKNLHHWRSTGEVRSKKHRIIKTQRFHLKIIDYFSSPIPCHHTNRTHCMISVSYYS